MLTQAPVSTTFALNGFVSLGRLNNEWRTAYAPIEDFANRFLDLVPQWADKYPWPIDPVRCWFRPFEYPYVVEHLPERATILDVGTAVTFFPLYLAALGHKIIAVDCDSRLLGFWEKMCAVLPENWRELPRSIEYRISNEYGIPVSEKVDAVTCISVLEHVPEPPKLLREMLSKLKSRGTLILTMDVSLEAPVGVSAEHFAEIQDILRELCRPGCEDGEPVHPHDLIVWPANPAILPVAAKTPAPERPLVRRIASRVLHSLDKPVPVIGRSICLYVGTFIKN